MPVPEESRDACGAYLESWPLLRSDGLAALPTELLQANRKELTALLDEQSLITREGKKEARFHASEHSRPSEEDPLLSYARRQRERVDSILRERAALQRVQHLLEGRLTRGDEHEEKDGTKSQPQASRAVESQEAFVPHDRSTGLISTFQGDVVRLCPASFLGEVSSKQRVLPDPGDERQDDPVRNIPMFSSEQESLSMNRGERLSKDCQPPRERVSPRPGVRRQRDPGKSIPVFTSGQENVCRSGSSRLDEKPEAPQAKAFGQARYGRSNDLPAESFMAKHWGSVFIVGAGGGKRRRKPPAKRRPLDAEQTAAQERAQVEKERLERRKASLRRLLARKEQQAKQKEARRKRKGAARRMLTTLTRTSVNGSMVVESPMAGESQCCRRPRRFLEAADTPNEEKHNSDVTPVDPAWTSHRIDRGMILSKLSSLNAVSVRENDNGNHPSPGTNRNRPTRNSSEPGDFESKSAEDETVSTGSSESESVSGGDSSEDDLPRYHEGGDKTRHATAEEQEVGTGGGKREIHSGWQEEEGTACFARLRSPRDTPGPMPNVSPAGHGVRDLSECNASHLRNTEHERCFECFEVHDVGVRSRTPDVATVGQRAPSQDEIESSEDRRMVWRRLEVDDKGTWEPRKDRGEDDVRTRTREACLHRGFHAVGEEDAAVAQLHDGKEEDQACSSPSVIVGGASPGADALGPCVSGQALPSTPIDESCDIADDEIDHLCHVEQTTSRGLFEHYSSGSLEKGVLPLSPSAETTLCGAPVVDNHPPCQGGLSSSEITRSGCGETDSPVPEIISVPFHVAEEVQAQRGALPEEQSSSPDRVLVEVVGDSPCISRQISPPVKPPTKGHVASRVDSIGGRRADLCRMGVSSPMASDPRSGDRVPELNPDGCQSLSVDPETLPSDGAVRSSNESSPESEISRPLSLHDAEAGLSVPGCRGLPRRNAREGRWESGSRFAASKVVGGDCPISMLEPLVSPNPRHGSNLVLDAPTEQRSHESSSENISANLPNAVPESSTGSAQAPRKMHSARRIPSSRGGELHGSSTTAAVDSTAGKRDFRYATFYPKFAAILSAFRTGRAVTRDTDGCTLPLTSSATAKTRARSMKGASGLTKTQEGALLTSQLKLYAIYLRVIKDYAAVFSYGDSLEGPAVDDPSYLVCSGNPSTLHYRVISKSRPEVYNIVTEVLQSRYKHWEELPTGLGLRTSWNLLWTWSKPHIQYSGLLAWQKVNHFPNSRELTRKDLLKKHLLRFMVPGGRLAREFHIMPQTFVLPHEFTLFVAAFTSSDSSRIHRDPASSAGDDNLAEGASGFGDGGLLDQEGCHSGREKQGGGRRGVWIMKPVGMSRGRGIRLVDDIKNIKYSEKVVVQRYVGNPLLLDGYKFDLRLYVLVTSFNCLEAFIYKEGFARLSTHPYVEDDITNVFVHITNSSIQRLNNTGAARDGPLRSASSSEAGGTKTTLSYLWRRLAGEGIDVGALWANICSVIVKSLVCVEGSIPNQPNRGFLFAMRALFADLVLMYIRARSDSWSAKSFEIFGYDVLIDDRLRPWLLEVNSSPSMGRQTQVDRQVKEALIYDTIQLVDPLPFDRRKLVDVLARRLSEARDSTTRPFKKRTQDEDRLDRDMEEILGGRRPRQVGELPERMGGFVRLCPGTAAHRHAKRLRRRVVRPQPGEDSGDEQL